MINIDRSKMLDLRFFENLVWVALHKAWKGYVIAKNKDEHDKMERYARIIQESQYDLGLDACFQMPRLIILRGPMGSGKTSVGKYLRDRLEDSDELDLDLIANSEISLDVGKGKCNS